MKTSTLVGKISDLLTANVGLVPSESFTFEESSTTGKGNLQTRFNIDIQTSDTGKLRQREHIRLQHLIAIDVLHAIKTKQLGTSQVEMLDIEGRIVDYMMDQSLIPEVRTQYISTSRNVVLGGRYLKSSIKFSVEDSYTLGQSK